MSSFPSPYSRTESFSRSASVFELDEIEEIHFQHNKVVSVTVNKKLKRLKEINLSENKLEQFKGANQFLPNLKILNLSKNRITNLHFVDFENKIEELNISENPIKSFKKLFLLHNIKKLDVSKTHFSDVNRLLEFHSLQELNLEGTSVKDISVLFKKKMDFRKLKRIRLSNEGVLPCSPLKIEERNTKSCVGAN